MGFVGNYAPCGLSPQTDGMPVIHNTQRTVSLSALRMCSVAPYVDDASMFLLADDSMNITAEILDGLNAEYNSESAD